MQVEGRRNINRSNYRIYHRMKNMIIRGGKRMLPEGHAKCWLGSRGNLYLMAW